MSWGEHMERTGKERNAYRILVGKPDGKRPLRRPRFWWRIILRLGLEK
jgi:hypothetical protein